MDTTIIGTAAQTLMASLEGDEDLTNAKILDVAIVVAVAHPSGEAEPDFGDGSYFYRVASSSKYNYVKLGLLQQGVQACLEGEDLEEPGPPDEGG